MLKKIIRSIDHAFFQDRYQQYRYQKKLNKSLRRLVKGLDYQISSFYKKNAGNPISFLCDRYGSDKGSLTHDGHPYPWPAHTYADYYFQLFGHAKHTIRKVFECGLGTNNPHLASSMGVKGKPGASLRVWRDFFPNAMVYGADIDRDILFSEERIKTFYVDQLNPGAIAHLWQEIGESNFDLMIDDGLHTFEAGSTLFTHSIDRLSETGVYIIEDVGLYDLMQYKQFFQNTNYIVDFIALFRPNLEMGDNGLVVIRKPHIVG